MFALTCFLIIGLLSSVDTLMEAAQTPDFLQMHAGEIDEASLVRFAGEQEQVRDYQTLRFLNLENHVIEEVQSGEIYVPVCYRQMFGLNVGEMVQIGEAAVSRWLAEMGW